MGQFTITTNAKVNSAPSRIGNLILNLDYNEEYTFTVADFTTNTVPTYLDPDGDDIESIKIITLPTIGSLTNDVTPVSPNDIIDKNVIIAGLLKYQADGTDIDGYTDSDMNFDISDEGSSTFSGLTPAIVTINVGVKPNEAPTQVGDNSETINYGETLIFTRAMFTSSTIPIYSDPEGDDADLLKVTALPNSGTLTINGFVVTLNQTITFADIDNGLFTYTGDPAVISGGTTDFEFQIADTGSGIFVG